MRLGSKSSGLVISGLASCLAFTLIAGASPASALDREGLPARVSRDMPIATWTPDNGDGTATNPVLL